MSSDNNLTNSPAVKAINHECDRTLTLSLYHPSVFMTIFIIIIIISTNRSYHIHLLQVCFSPPICMYVYPSIIKSRGLLSDIRRQHHINILSLYWTTIIGFMELSKDNRCQYHINIYSLYNSLNTIHSKNNDIYVVLSQVDCSFFNRW